MFARMYLDNPARPPNAARSNGKMRCRIRSQKAMAGGSYILRTNWTETDLKMIWNTYIRLTEVEDSFRTEKHDLGVRPIFHQKQERTRAHILICFLALTM